MIIRDWSSDVCSSDLPKHNLQAGHFSVKTPGHFSAAINKPSIRGPDRATRNMSGSRERSADRLRIQACTHWRPDRLRSNGRRRLPAIAEERRVEQGCVRTGKIRWSTVHKKKNK